LWKPHETREENRFEDFEEVVRLARFELATCCFGGNRSIQLSYSRTEVIP
jgi:hypothetical protein